MKKMGYASSNETADSILREVDFGRKGAIEFQEYLDVSRLGAWQRYRADVVVDRCWIEGAAHRVCLYASCSIGHVEKPSRG
jgi:hypothetical protein